MNLGANIRASSLMAKAAAERNALLSNRYWLQAALIENGSTASSAAELPKIASVREPSIQSLNTDEKAKKTAFVPVECTCTGTDLASRKYCWTNHPKTKMEVAWNESRKRGFPDVSTFYRDDPYY